MAHGSAANEVKRTMRNIFKRCVECEPQTPTCPACPEGDICSLVPQSCDSCAHMVCIANPNPTPKAEKPNVGAIAGGVIGGVVFISLIVFLFWRYWIKKRRQEQEEWDEDDEIATQKGVSQFNAMKSDNASTRTRGSVAASFLSRASNIIHIAYIPGVTNRNGSGHNSLLNAAPVPPIPAAYANQTSRTTTPKSPLSNEGDALFFRPSDLRDTMYSDSSSLRSGKRDTQYTTHSITPSLARSSMMSDVYRDDATTEPMPATQVIRALPRMVSVKSGTSATSTPSMESAPTLAPPSSSGSGVKTVMLGEKSSDGSPSSSHHTGGTFIKATPVTIGGKGKVRTPGVSRQASDASSSTGSSNTKPLKPSPLVETANESDEEDEHARARKSLIRETTAAAASPAPLIQPLESPFFDATELQTSASSSSQGSRPNPYAAMSASVGSGPRPKRNDNRTPGGLSAVIEEAAKRASQEPEHDGIGGKRDQSPFSDAHATK
ncbi:hypothetical protein CKM354_000545100 [Cercospora kikuchii]|uniref:Membrane anchor Opy2 N-terminal domain-containing protein n=1 Tax=Cercospora kikuchii TaxID=84275 RepID=A0A9P3CG75_9PEZI|nr:uncharacterized protein CKM354_000545100 [Cercospora kikuchii]GIZ42173.1 hypothetical protein CKM354_000545100 [Cercospora kikuchii]